MKTIKTRKKSSITETRTKDRDLLSELNSANKEIAEQIIQKKKREIELGIANKELSYQQSEKADRANELVIANKELVFQKQEKKNRANELKLANKELAYQKQEKRHRATELKIVKKTIIHQEVKIENLSYRNELPILYNRKYFLDSLNKYDTETNLPISIIMGDINGLAIIDDSLGHSVVDDVQKKLNNILKKVARKADVLIGFSNGEFSLILPKTTYLESVEIINQLQSLSSKEEAGPSKLSISCGSSTKKTVDNDMSNIIREATEQLEKDRSIASPIFESHTINLIMGMLFEKNNREMLHSSRVSLICEKIATKLNFDQGVIDRIRITALLHDIGKIGIDERILNKTESLTEKEWTEVRKHPETGFRILNASNEFIIHAEDVLEHHERIDGKGYPRGIKGDEISIVAKIIAIADTYDAITSDRPYRKALSKHDAIVEIERCSGSQFDSEVVKVFVDMLLEKENINL